VEAEAATSVVAPEAVAAEVDEAEAEVEATALVEVASEADEMEAVRVEMEAGARLRQNRRKHNRSSTRRRLLTLPLDSCMHCRLRCSAKAFGLSRGFA